MRPLTRAVTRAVTSWEPGRLSPAERERLDSEGYLALPSILDLEQVEDALAIVRELLGGSAERTSGTLHLSGLAGRAPLLDTAWSHPLVLTAVRHVLGDEVRLSELAYRAPLPGYGAQAIHADWAEPVEQGDYLVCSAVVALTDFDPTNGSTRVVPGSHRWRAVPRKAQPGRWQPGERRLTGRAGTAFVINGHLWHSGTLNEGRTPRHALLASFARADVRRFDASAPCLPIAPGGKGRAT